MDIKVEGPWNTEKCLSATMIGQLGKFLNSRRCRMAKVVTFWLWWQSYNSFVLRLFLFLLCFSFSFSCAKKWGDHVPGPSAVAGSAGGILFGDICITPLWFYSGFFSRILVRFFQEILLLITNWRYMKAFVGVNIKLVIIFSFLRGLKITSFIWDSFNEILLALSLSVSHFSSLFLTQDIVSTFVTKY